MKILHLISGLKTGGTELFLERLLQAMDASEFESAVVSLGQIGPVGERLRKRGISVDALRAGFSPAGIVALFKIGKLARRCEPDLIQGWMYHGNLGASLARRVAGRRCPVVWNVRHCLDGWRYETIGLRGLIRLGGRMSGSANKIIFNSTAAARQHERLGFPASKALVIPNGIDCGVYKPEQRARDSLRSRLGFSADSLVVGIVGRYHPVKDHETFLRAARLVISKVPRARFILVGRDITSDNPTLAGLIDTLGLKRQVVLLGEREDVPTIMNAMDIYVCSSWAESFPNVVAEAMACGIPCVVTDVGASAELVDDTGRIAPSGSPDALAAAVLDLLSIDSNQRAHLGASARQRILQFYNHDDIVKQYADLYRRLRESYGTR
ncbi:MAG: GT4 family glycosyltransferase PelF [Gammaproteobacteria bacterium]